MPSYDSTLFNVNPYYDDFSEDKKFLRMIFRPGYAVQARELTQLQTILQNQIERFGNHIFKDGTRIIGGEITTQTLNYVRILPNTTNTPSIQLTENDLVGFNLIQRGATGSVVAKANVVKFLPSYSESDSYGIAVISYLSGVTFSLGATLESDNPDKYMVVQVPGSANIPISGKSRIVSTSEGIYYVDGCFVKTDASLSPAYEIEDETRNFETPTGFMGFDVVKTIVTEKDDYTLKDPANGSYNYNAPGAHRFKIDLQLKFVESKVGENFIELVSYEEGEVLKRFDKTEYAELTRLFAQRTYDESGNYVVEPFDIYFKDQGQTYARAYIGPGKAYVFGYEYETRFVDTIDIPKARTTADYTNYTIDNEFKNFLVGTYNPSAGDRLNSIFRDLNAGEKSVAVEVYGNTYALTNFAQYGYSGPGGSTFSGENETVVFNGYLMKFEPFDDDIFSTQETSAGMTMKAYISNVNRYPGVSGEINHPLNLYMVDRETGLSYKLLSDIDLYRDTPGGTGSSLRMPDFSDLNSQLLVYPLNGNTPTTMIKSVDDISYITTVSRAFVVDDANPFPSVSLSLGNHFNWCTGEGLVPDGNDVVLDEFDGYFVVAESSTSSQNPILRGELIKVISENTSVPGLYKLTAKITGDGDSVTMMRKLPNGSYYLVGKAKSVVNNVSSIPNLGSRIRTKTLVSSYQERISNIDPTIGFERDIKTNASGSISEMFFLLEKSDIFALESVTDSTGNSIIDEFLFDGGMRDAVYIRGRLYVKPEYYEKYSSGSQFTIVATYSYFEHSGFGPFLKESYQGISYDDIPVFVSPLTGKSIHLANAADYRFKAETTGYSFSGATAGTIGITSPNNIFNRPIIRVLNGMVPDKASIKSSHEAYLPRIDKIVISRDLSADGAFTTINRVAGIASDSPILPEDLGDSMTLFALSIPAYTFNASDIKAQSPGNNRFTMKDIGNISKRVESLEEYSILTDLERSVAERVLRLTDGDEAIKKAILVDPFSGHSIADVRNIDYRCSIDFERGELRPSFDSNAYSFEYNGFDPGLTLTTDNILCLAIDSTSPAIVQNKASSTVKINPFGLPNWVGNIKTTPYADYWYDNETRPIVKSNEGQNDAWLIGRINDKNGHGSQWNDWESIWTGISVELTDVESRKNVEFFAKTREKQTSDDSRKRWYSKEDIGTFTEPLEIVRKDYVSDFRRTKDYYTVAENTILNKSILPKMRTKTVTFNVYNMKPNTQVHAFFDNINVNQYCTYQGSTGPFTTSATDGSLIGIQFSIPSGMFECGEKIFRLTDDANNSIEDATTIAESVFYATGVKPDNRFNVSSIRPVEIRKQTPNSNKVVSNPLFKNKSINTTKYNQWIDPLAQTFEISEGDYPNGLYLDSIDLHFSSKDSSLPVTVEICPTVNGVPHSSVILPFSTVVKSASSVNANSTTPVPTNFKFSTPVYLAPGGYSLVVRTNSPKYSLYVGDIGELDLVTEERISSTFNGGVLYTANNSSQASAVSNKDLMFCLNKCKFKTSPNSVALNFVGQGTTQIVQVVQSNAYLFVSPNISLNTQLTLDVQNYSTANGRNVHLPQSFTINDSSTMNIVANISDTSGGDGTFMIDMDRTNVVAVGYVINSSDSSFSNEITPFSGIADDDTARYITRQIRLPDGETARELAVIFDTNYPQDTWIRVYGKMYNAKQRDFPVELEPYERLTVQPDSGFFDVLSQSLQRATNPNDFREMKYQNFPNRTEDFDTFAVKICLFTSNKANVPVIKNLRVVALK